MRQRPSNSGRSPSVNITMESSSVVPATRSRDRDLNPVTALTVAQALHNTKEAVNSIGESPLERDPDTGEVKIKGEKTDSWIGAATLPMVTLFALTGLVSGACSFYLVVGILFDVASAVLVVSSVAVVVQRRELRKLGGFRALHNQLRAMVNTIHTENRRLSNTVTQLENHQKSLAHVQADLETAAANSGAQVDRLLKIVESNAELQGQLRSKLQGQVVQQIMSAILHTDSDRNFVLAPAEVDTLITRLEHLPGVEFRADKFRQRIASDQGDLTLSDVCMIARNLDQELTDKEEAIFCFQTKALRGSLSSA